MNKTLLAGAVMLGVAVFCLLGAFGVGDNTLADLFGSLGASPDLADRLSRAVSGGFLAVAIFLQVIGWAKEADGRAVSSEEFRAVKEYVERTDQKGDHHGN